MPKKTSKQNIKNKKVKKRTYNEMISEYKKSLNNNINNEEEINKEDNINKKKKRILYRTE